MEKLLIITGGSKGIGNGIIYEYLQNGYMVYTISRSRNNTPEFEKVNQILSDLNNLNHLENILTETLSKVDLQKLSHITLINNAGTLGEITTIDRNTPEDIENTIRLNTTVPLILISKFIALTQHVDCRKKIINISSGAAQNPYFGWVTYCASKSALDMITRAVALEQKDLKNPVNIISIYPGVVDTEMQSQIRKSSKTDFADIEKFIGYKSSGLLATPAQVGSEIYRIDHDDKVESGSLIRVNDNRSTIAK